MCSTTAVGESRPGLSWRHTSGRSLRSGCHAASVWRRWDHAHGLVVGEHPLELHAAEEQGLVGAGALLHDAGDAGIVIVPQAEGLRAPGEPSLPHREGKGAVEGEDERAAGRLVLELLEEDEEQRLEPLVLVEPAVPHVPVEVRLADPEGDGPDQGGKGRRRRHGPGQADGAHIDAELQRGEGEELLPALQEGGRELGGQLPPGHGGAQVRIEVVAGGVGRQRGERQAPAAVVQGGVDDQPRAVAARLPLGQVRERGEAQQALGHDLGRGSGPPATS